MPVDEKDILGQMIAWEQGDLGEEDTVKLFQHLVDTGLAYQLQGIYGRTAESLISQGYITEAGVHDE